MTKLVGILQNKFFNLKLDFNLDSYFVSTSKHILKNISSLKKLLHPTDEYRINRQVKPTVKPTVKQHSTYEK